MSIRVNPEYKWADLQSIALEVPLFTEGQLVTAVEAERKKCLKEVFDFLLELHTS